MTAPQMIGRAERRPTPSQRRFLERLASGPKLKVQVHASGDGMAPRRCMEAGWCRIGDDPTVRDSFGDPAPAYFITTAGLAALDRPAFEAERAREAERIAAQSKESR